MSKSNEAVPLVYDSAAGQVPTEKNDAERPHNAIEHYKYYDQLLNMLSDELAIIDRPRDPVWNARIAELEAQLDVDGLAQAFALALELSQKLSGKP